MDYYCSGAHVNNLLAKYLPDIAVGERDKVKRRIENERAIRLAGVMYLDSCPLGNESVARE